MRISDWSSDVCSSDLLRSVREEFGGPAFVGFDVRRRRADDAVIGLAERGERERVGRRAVEGEEDLAACFEERPEGVGSALCPFVVAVGRRRGRVRGSHRIPCFGTNARIIIAGKLLWLG